MGIQAAFDVSGGELVQQELLVDFGRHKGRHFPQVNEGYLRWMLTSFPESSQWHKAAANALLLRAGTKPTYGLLTDLKSCNDLERGRRIHTEVMESGNDSNMYVATALIRMYAKCGSMADAHRVFESVQKPDVVCWSALLLGYAVNGQGRFCLDLFAKMQADGCAPDSVAYVAALKACTSMAVSGDGSGKAEALKLGSEIHLQIGSHLVLYVQNTLIDLYAKCSSMVNARRVFDSITKPDVVSWNALLLGYVDNGQGNVSLELFSKMSCAPTCVTYIAALKACTSLAVNGDAVRGLKMGRRIHSLIGDQLVRSVQNTLIDMYAKCGSMLNAREVFDSIKTPDVVSWNALLLGYAENGEGQFSIELFSRMKADAFVPNSITYIALLKACTSLAANGNPSCKAHGLKMVREIHLQIGDHSVVNLQNTLIDTYAKCGSMVDAYQVFTSIRNPDVVSWNALLLGYVEDGQGQICLELFSRMKAGGHAPNHVTYVAALKASASIAGDGGSKAQGLEMGRKIHLEIGDQLNSYVQSALIDMYANCGSMPNARKVFESISNPDVVCWNALVLGYAEAGQGHISLELFSKMKAEGCVADSVTYIAALKACASIGALSLGRKLHSEMSEFTINIVTCLVDFYTKCGSMVEAQAVFDLHTKARDVKTWSVLLAGYSSCGNTSAVFSVLKLMQKAGFQPNEFTFMYLLLCCSRAGLVAKARQYLEAMPVHYKVTPDVFHFNCMVDVLCRANRLCEAVSELRKMPCNPDAATWSTLLGACHKWKNLQVARMAFQSLVAMDDKKDASAYVVMARIYGSRGMWEEQARVLESVMR